MTTSTAAILTIKISVNSQVLQQFADWHAKLNAAITCFGGFVSLEILRSGDDPSQWQIAQRFSDTGSLRMWQKSAEYQTLLTDLNRLLIKSSSARIEEIETDTHSLEGCVTEVFITQVNPDKIPEYKAWMAKIHEVELKFEGFKGVYIQAPCIGQGTSWITLLQFDTPENLDRWLASPERLGVLQESTSLISSIESHRLLSPYSGWFSSMARSGEFPPVWKEAMLVLLVLFPIVMLQIRFLSPVTADLSPPLAMFLANTMSVALISWPFMPIAIRYLKWWLYPHGSVRLKTIVGTGVVLALYALEVIFFTLFW